MKVDKMGIVATCVILILFGWILGMQTEQYLIKSSYHTIQKEKNARQIYNDSIENLNIGDEYLKDSCYDSTLKHIAKDDYEKQIGG